MFKKSILYFIDFLSTPNCKDEYIFNSIIGLISIVSHWIPPSQISNNIDNNEDSKYKEIDNKNETYKKLKLLQQKKDKELEMMEKTPEAFARRAESSKKLALLLVDIIKSHIKIGPIIGYSFSLLTFLINSVTDLLKGKGIVILSSLMLSTHKDEKLIVQYILSFLYEISKYDVYVEEIKLSKPLIPTIKWSFLI